MAFVDFYFDKNHDDDENTCCHGDDERPPGFTGQGFWESQTRTNKNIDGLKP
jgi:hypothetical protein